MEKQNSFDKLVSGLSGDERKAMLSKMQTDSADVEVFEAVEVYDKNAKLNIEEQLKNESIFVRFVVWLKSLVSGSKPVSVYNFQILQSMIRKVDRDYPSLIDNRREMLLAEFYQKLSQLRVCANFFRKYISMCEEDVNDYYVFLGSIVMDFVDEAMEEDVNPFKLSYDREITTELRSSLLRAQDSIFNKISVDKRNEMYEAVRGYEWLRQLCRLPFDVLVTRFQSIGDGACVCPYSQIDGVNGDLVALCRVMCNTRPLPDSMLKSLFLFNSKHLVAQDLDTLDLQNTPEAFVRQAQSQVAMIRMFVQSIPLRTLTCIVFKDASWIPETLGGGEEWFVKYKAQWKRIFDQQWHSWTTEAKKEKLKTTLLSFFGIESYPLLPNRPWTFIWNGLPYRYDLTMGFLRYFMIEKYTKEYVPTLKIIVLEGEFLKKDSQSEFTDVFNEFSELMQDINGENNMLDPTGEWGMIFANIADKQLRKANDELKIKQLMEQIEVNSTMILQKFGRLSRILVDMLKALQGENVQVNYGALVNLSDIQGKNNEAFRKNLTLVIEGLSHAIQIVTELEPLDAPMSNT